MYVFTHSLSHKQNVTQGHFLWNTVGLNKEISFFYAGCHTKAKEPSLSIVGERTVGFMPFFRALVKSEMQLALSRIWTWIPDFISYYDNNYINTFPTLQYANRKDFYLP